MDPAGVPRPVITFLSDFGADAAAAICRGVMLGIAPDAQIIDISHSVRKFAVRDGAILLGWALPWMPVGIHLAVIDPGVGTARRAVALRVERGDIVVGPDNGLLRPAVDRLGGLVEARVLDNAELMLPRTTNTFHGRDVFAPMAAHLAIGRAFADVGPVIDPSTLVELRLPAPTIEPGRLVTSVLYVDSFGNLRLAGDRAALEQAVGPLDPGRPLKITFDASEEWPLVREDTIWATTFGQLAPGLALLYEDSFGGLAYADNQGDAARRLAVGPDRSVRIEPA